MIKMTKRMIAVFTSVMLMFNLSGCGETEARKSGENRIDEIIANMTLEDKIEQMMFVSYRTWKEVREKESADAVLTVENAEEDIPAVNITELNDEMRTSLQEHHYGGMLLFGENFKDADQTLRLIADIQQTTLDIILVAERGYIGHKHQINAQLLTDSADLIVVLSVLQLLEISGTLYSLEVSVLSHACYQLAAQDLLDLRVKAFRSGYVHGHLLLGHQYSWQSQQ